MNEKIVAEYISLKPNVDFTDFPKINEMLENGWLVKNWDITTSTNPITIMVVAVLQKV